MNKQLLIETKEDFGDFYNDWRLKRIAKLESILGLSWFKGKKVLELGCGYGNIGLYLKSLGAEVTFSDARQECLNTVLSKDPIVKTLLLDQETEYSLPEVYDLIIHFGISYNLKNWDKDLQIVLKHCKVLAYETAVNKFKGNITFKIKDYKYSHNFHGPFQKEGSLTTVENINSLFKEFNFSLYEDYNLNSGGFLYTLPHSITELSNTSNKDLVTNHWATPSITGGRKFWIVKVIND
jgi:SAM-dependent methyltransferase